MADISITTTGGVITVEDEAFSGVFTYTPGDYVVERYEPSGPYDQETYTSANVHGKKCKDEDLLVIQNGSDPGKGRMHVFCFSECTDPVHANAELLQASIAGMLKGSTGAITTYQQIFTPTNGQTVFTLNDPIVDPLTVQFFRNGVLQQPGTGIQTPLAADTTITYLLGGTAPMVTTDSIIVYYS